MKKISLLLLCVLLTAVLLFSCGDDPVTPEPTPDNPTPEEPDPEPEETTYLITFKDENGTTLESKKWKENATPTYTYTKADTAEWDYTVEGWSLTQGGDLVTVSAATKDTTYYAIVTEVKNQYTLTFDVQGGSTIESQTKEYGSSISAPEAPTKEKYTFEGWYQDKDYNDPIAWPINLRGDQTIFAKWTKNTYLITFKDEDGVVLESKKWEEDDTPSYAYIKADTDEWDYTVEGWALTKGGDKVTPSAVTQEATYFAIVSQVKKQYTLTFNVNGGSAVDSQTKDYGTSISAPSAPTKDGYVFVSWCTDEALETAVEWPLTITKDQTIYAKWNEKVDVKGFLAAMMEATEQDPYSFIPDTMKPTYEANYVSQDDVTYDFSDFVNISSISYGGFGEQWHMVIDNIQQSELFFNILTMGDSAISASVTAFNNYFDKNPSDTNKEITETGYYAKVNFADNVLTYTIQIKTSLTIPFFGTVLPQIDMTYNIETNEKVVRLNLTENNAMRYVITEDAYKFGIEYGVDDVSRSAYCEIKREKDGSVNGHIYEYITLKGKDAVKSCADFYITNTYASVVGNKASGIILMDGYINELYNVQTGKLLGYKVQETKTVLSVSGTYHTLWFNLSDISGITSIKVTDHTEDNTNSLNTNNIYINGNTALFTPTYNTKLMVKTSRKYDIEMRTQYFYGMVGEQLTCFSVQVPMMFIQDDHDGYTNYSDYTSDVKKANSITSAVTLSSTYLTKIRADYDALIPTFITNKETQDSTSIKTWIGTAVQ